MMPTQFVTQSAAENIFIVVSQALLPSFMCGIVVSGIFRRVHELVVVIPDYRRFRGR